MSVLSSRDLVGHGLHLLHDRLGLLLHGLSRLGDGAHGLVLDFLNGLGGLVLDFLNGLGSFVLDLFRGLDDLVQLFAHFSALLSACGAAGVAPNC